MPLPDLKHKPPRLHHIVVKLVPRRHRREPRARDMRQGVEVEAVDCEEEEVDCEEGEEEEGEHSSFSNFKVFGFYFLFSIFGWEGRERGKGGQRFSG